MKTVYVCEKCGANHDNYDAAYKCEESHANIYIGGDYASEVKDKSVWKNGDVLQRTCVLPSEEKYMEDPDTGEYRYVTFFGVYELKRMLKDDEVNRIEDLHELRKQKEEEDYRKWQAEYRRSQEEKAAREAAQKAAEEAQASDDNDEEMESA